MSSIFGNNPASSVDPTTDAFIASLVPKQNPAPTTSKTERKPSEHWLNIGLTVPGFGENGEDVFISFGGIALDDMKPIEVKGNNPNWVKLQQAKAQLQALVLGQAGSLAPGEKKPIRLTCEVSRAAKPAQQPEAGGSIANAVNGAFAGILVSG